jgi:hypothetical protein
MYVEVREKNSKYFVILRGEDLYRHEDSKGKQFAHFVSTNKNEANNVAKQFAKQNKCLIRWTSGGIETPELPTQPDSPGAEG